MKTKHRKTLAAIYRHPTASGIVFADIEALVVALGGEVREGDGSRVAFELGDAAAGFTCTGRTPARRPRSIRSRTCAPGWTKEESDHDQRAQVSGLHRPHRV